MGKVSIRLDLTDDAVKQFLSLKIKRGLKNDSEPIMRLITEGCLEGIIACPMRVLHD